MFSQTIEKLKLLTLNKAADFGECMNCFLDLTEDPKFIAEGDQISGDNEFFTALLKPVTNFFGIEGSVNSLFLIRVKNYHLIHGVARLPNQRPVMLYYFEDIQSGVIGTSETGKQSHFFRITLKGNAVQESNMLH